MTQQQTGRLHNKVAIITGASSGIGRATAKLFAAEGAKVVVGARRESELASLVAEIKASGGTAVALAGDVRSEAYAKALVELAHQNWEIPKLSNTRFEVVSSSMRANAARVPQTLQNCAPGFNVAPHWEQFIEKLLLTFPE